MKRLTIILLSFLLIFSSTLSVFADEDIEDTTDVINDSEVMEDDENEESTSTIDENITEDIVQDDFGVETNNNNEIAPDNNMFKAPLMASNKSVPEDLDIYQDYDGDLSICSSNQNYLDSISSIKLYYYTSVSGDAIENRNRSLSGDYDYSYIGTINYSYMYNGWYEQLRVSSEKLYSYNLYRNIIYVETIASGYLPCVTKVYINVNLGYILSVPDDLQIIQNENGLCFYTSHNEYVEEIKTIYLGNSNYERSFSSSEISYNSQYNYFYIDNNTLANKLFTGIYNYIIIESNNYQNYTNNRINVAINSNIKDISKEVTFHYDSSVGLEIICEDHDYLKNINEITLYIENMNYYGFFYNCFIYDLKNNKLIIKEDDILKENLDSNDNYQVTIYAKNYKDNEISHVSLDFGNKKPGEEIPSDISFSYDKNIGLIISSDDKNYLKNIKKINLVINDNMQSVEESLICYNEFDECIYINNNYVHDFENEEHIYECTIISDNYNKAVFTGLDIIMPVQKQTKTAPDKVSVYSAKYEGIYLTFNMEEYVDNIENIEFYVNTGKGKEYIWINDFVKTDNTIYISQEEINRVGITGLCKEIYISSN